MVVKGNQNDEIVNLGINKTVYEEFEKHVNMKNKWKPPLDRKFSESLFLSIFSNFFFQNFVDRWLVEK